MPKLNGVEYHGQGIVDTEKKNQIKSVDRHIKFHEKNKIHGSSSSSRNVRNANTSVKSVEDVLMAVGVPKSSIQKAKASGKLNGTSVESYGFVFYFLGFLAVICNVLGAQPMGMGFTVLLFILGSKLQDNKGRVFGVLAILAPVIALVIYIGFQFGFEHLQGWEIEYAIEHLFSH